MIRVLRKRFERLVFHPEALKIHNLRFQNILYSTNVFFLIFNNKKLTNLCVVFAQNLCEFTQKFLECNSRFLVPCSCRFVAYYTKVYFAKQQKKTYRNYIFGVFLIKFFFVCLLYNQ
jgi:hypothetical protein